MIFDITCCILLLSSWLLRDIFLDFFLGITISMYELDCLQDDVVELEYDVEDRNLDFLLKICEFVEMMMSLWRSWNSVLVGDEAY